MIIDLLGFTTKLLTGLSIIIIVVVLVASSFEIHDGR